MSFSQQSVVDTTYTTTISKTSPVFEKTLPYVIDGVNIVPPGFKMLKAGRLLTFFGSLMIATGGIVTSIANGQGNYDPYTQKTTVSSKGVFGRVLIIAGAGMAVPGVVLWSKGSKKYDSYLKSKAATTSIQFRVNGLSLNYRF